MTDYLSDKRPRTALDKSLEFLSKNADEKSLLEMKSIFPRWAVGTNYEKNQIIEFNDDLYRINQAHRSQEDWLPPDVPALYTRIESPGEIGSWRQPQGTHDAYKKGDKVIHNQNTWESSIDANVWEPGVYGWKEVIE